MGAGVAEDDGPGRGDHGRVPRDRPIANRSAGPYGVQFWSFTGPRRRSRRGHRGARGLAREARGDAGQARRPDDPRGGEVPREEPLRRPARQHPAHQRGLGHQGRPLRHLGHGEETQGHGVGARRQPQAGYRQVDRSHRQAGDDTRGDLHQGGAHPASPRRRRRRPTSSRRRLRRSPRSRRWWCSRFPRRRHRGGADSRFVVQFSKDMDENTFDGHVVLRYTGPVLPGIAPRRHEAHLRPRAARAHRRSRRRAAAPAADRADPAARHLDIDGLTR